MKIEFKNKNLLKLYAEGKSGKYKLPATIQKKFFMRVQQLEAANTIHDLMITASLKFERLKRYENRYSIRINEAYRLEFEIEWEDKHCTKGVVIILDISKHYGD